MGLLSKDTIEVHTERGLCKVELLYGSITKLKRADAVDVLVLSACPGIYHPVRGTVIAALLKDLKVNVKELSLDKEEDLRKFFSCWWSKPLPSHLKLPFERVMCFEGSFKAGSKPPGVIGEVFRSLVSLCKNNDIRVIMPLLATGVQSYAETMILRLTVDAAIHWMQIGLPLRVLKIVIYREKPSKINFVNDEVFQYFQELKTKWQEKLAVESALKKLTIRYDVYLSYCPIDEKLAQCVKQQLNVIKQDVRIFDEKQEINNEESWQEEIYQVMSMCTRVVTLLTPSFLKDDTCIEQYNIALCCTRNMKRDYLAPLYVTDIEQMPTYMGLIQYVDCRPQDQMKIASACQQLATWLIDHKSSTPILKKLPAPKSPPLIWKKNTYDIFISYSHADSKTAERIQEFIHSVAPDLRIFIDTDVLQAGTAWQLTLYNSIESSKVILALLSSSYFASKVCQEEYNLGVFLHKDPMYLSKVLPIMIEKVDSIPLWCQAIESVCDIDVASKDGRMTLMTRLSQLIKAYDEGHQDGSTGANCLLRNWRNEHCWRNMPYFPGLDLELSTPLNISKTETPEAEYEIDVFLSHHRNDQTYADQFVKMLKTFSPSAVISQPNKTSRRLELLDKAKIIVSLLSGDYINSLESFEELSTGLCRHRFGSHLTLFPVLLEHLRPSPAFLHILCTLFALEDQCWGGMRIPVGEHVSKRNMSCLTMIARCIAQFLADPQKLQGEFKTLLSLNEIEVSLTHMRTKAVNTDVLHPLTFTNLEKKSYDMVNTSPTSNQNTEKSAPSASASETSCKGDEQDDEFGEQSLNAPSEMGSSKTGTQASLYVSPPMVSKEIPRETPTSSGITAPSDTSNKIEDENLVSTTSGASVDPASGEAEETRTYLLKNLNLHQSATETKENQTVQDDGSKTEQGLVEEHKATSHPRETPTKSRDVQISDVSQPSISNEQTGSNQVPRAQGEHFLSNETQNSQTEDIQVKKSENKDNISAEETEPAPNEVNVTEDVESASSGNATNETDVEKAKSNRKKMKKQNSLSSTKVCLLM